MGEARTGKAWQGWVRHGFMKKKEKVVEALVGSGNIFKDLGYANPEEAKAKSDLSTQIYQIIKNRKLTQKQAAEILGIDQPKIPDIIRGKLSKYSIDRLMHFLMLLEIRGTPN